MSIQELSPNHLPPPYWRWEGRNQLSFIGSFGPIIDLYYRQQQLSRICVYNPRPPSSRPRMLITNKGIHPSLQEEGPKICIEYVKIIKMSLPYAQQIFGGAQKEAFVASLDASVKRLFSEALLYEKNIDGIDRIRVLNTFNA